MHARACLGSETCSRCSIPAMHHRGSVNDCWHPCSTCNCTECRIPELVPGIAAALSRLSLAEAQAVTAHRAELRGSSPALTAALHVATAGRGHYHEAIIDDLLARTELRGSSPALTAALHVATAGAVISLAPYAVTA